jgi:Cdc6-like AAA superfamily ATPase
MERGNALLYGSYGIGKTALLRYFLGECEFVKKHKVAPVYIEFLGTTPIDFLCAVAYAVGERFKDEDKDAAQLLRKLRGVETKKETETEKGGGFSLILRGEMKRVSISGEHVSVTLSTPYLLDSVGKILHRAAKKYYVAIGVDEVDKRNPREFITLITHLRPLLDTPASFILTGSHSFLSVASKVVVDEFGAFQRRIPVPPLKKELLVKMTERYLKHLTGNNLFEKGVLSELADLSRGNPRVMINLVRSTMDAAVRANKKINERTFRDLLFSVGREIHDRLPPHSRRVAQYIHARGSLSRVDKQVAEELNLHPTTVHYHINYLKSRDALIDYEENGSRKYYINPALAALFSKLPKGIRGITKPFARHDSRKKGA